MTTIDPADSGRPRAARRWTLVGVDGSIDVQVTADDDSRLHAALPTLERLAGTPAPALWAGSGRLSPDQRLDAPELAHGALLGLGRPVPRVAAGQRSSALELHVVGGPDAGRIAPLGQGRHVLGRGSMATVGLADPDVSRRHVLVQVGGGEITVADVGSTNGSLLDGQPLEATPRSWPAGAVLRLGASALTVTGPGGRGVGLEPAPGGRLRVRPDRRLSTPRAEVEVLFPRPPAPPQRRRLAWVAITLPAAGGVLMAWLLDTPSFLFFALLSPVVGLGTWLSERWTGRRAGRRDGAAHAVALHEAHTRLAQAVRADVRAAEAAAPDLAALTGAARRRSSLLWSRAGGDADALVVRLGTGPGPTGVTRIDPESGPARQSAPHAPVTCDLRTGGGLGVVGPRERAEGVLRAVVAQLCALHAPGDLDLALLSSPARLDSWAWARWLPHLDAGSVLVSTDAAAGSPEDREGDEALGAWLTALAARRRAGSPGSDRQGADRSGNPAAAGWLVVIVDRPLDARLTSTLRGARDAGILVLGATEPGSELPVAVDAVVRLGGETGDGAVLSRQGLPDRPVVAVDRLPSSVAATLARDLAPLIPAATSRDLPAAVRLLDLPAAGLTVRDEEVIGGWSRARDRLTAVLGRTSEGVLQVDLCRHGPHVLVAGTTGSGKSELLQTLIAGLALAHPPDRCSFLLVDYKGGAAFAEAAALPHTVGLVTDLDGQGTARALRSLGAELTRRESVLAAHGVSDIGALPASADLARLVIVVDEFATLAEELPAFVPGLVGIAQRGRSLGVHLVLATQRPGGVVSPEIRANCSLRICLRTTDEADSRDVLGTADAAHLPVDRPGRAYVRSGSGAPTALQVARVGVGGATTQPGGVQIARWTWPLTPPAASVVGTDGDTDLARLTRAVGRHAAATGAREPHRPWQPALPDRLPVEALRAGAADDTDRSRLRIGLVDHPDEQTQQPLELDLAEGGAWLAVGGPRSGRTTLLRTVLGEAVRRRGPDELQVHVVEAGGGLLGATARSLPHTGTTVDGDDVLRTVRLVDRLAQEVAGRRSDTGRDHPAILLLVDGVETLCALLDEADPGRGSAQFLRLVRDGAAVGVTCVLTADRAVPGGRIAGLARQRLVLPLPDRADYAVAGVPARAVPGHRPPGRALIGEDALECQLALPGPLAPRSTAGRPVPAPLRIVTLSADPVLEVGHDPLPDRLLLPVGPGGDSGEPLVLDLMRTGGLLVTGPPGCGRTTALEAFATHLAVGSSAAILRIGRPPAGWDRSDDGAAQWRDASDEAGVANWLAALDGRPCVVIADDLGGPLEQPALGRLPAPGARSGVVLLAAGAAASLSAHYSGPVAALRRNRCGLLLNPGPGDADLLGIRLPRLPLPVRPGSGWLVIGPGLERVQVARRHPAPADPRSTPGPDAARGPAAGPILAPVPVPR